MTLQRGDVLHYQGIKHTVTGFGQKGGVELTFPNGTVLRLSRKHIPRNAKVERPAPEAKPE